MSAKRTRKPLRSPFVTTVAVASAALITVAAGCVSSVQFTDSSCAFGDPGCTEPCPGSAPSDGSSCEQDGQSCSYGECSETHASCDGGRWQLSYLEIACNPPPPEPTCPATLPEWGTPCQISFNGPYTCNGYLDPFCDVPVSATCTVQGLWETDQVDCNPPPPALCNDISDWNLCEASGCQWLVPGCGAPALPAEGCFPYEECIDFGCSDGASCQQVVIDPCWNTPCDACGAEAYVCLPDGGG